MNRTTWREMPRGSATRFSSGQSANGVSHGSGSNCTFGVADKNLGTPSSLLIDLESSLQAVAHVRHQIAGRLDARRQSQQRRGDAGGQLHLGGH